MYSEAAHVGGQISDICEVTKGNLIQTRAFGGSPPGLNGPTLESKHHFHGDEPHEDECSRDDHNASKDWCYEDTVI